MDTDSFFYKNVKSDDDSAQKASKSHYSSVKSSKVRKPTKKTKIINALHMGFDFSSHATRHLQPGRLRDKKMNLNLVCEPKSSRRIKRESRSI